jgi:hypothetical protein
MKGLFLTYLTLLFAMQTLAQEKVEQRSGKAPAWTKSFVEMDYIIASGDGAGLGEAQQQALLMVKQNIARSIAEKITAESAYSISNDGESYRQNITSKAQRVPYIQGIAASKITEFYWEKIVDKSSKKTFYRYYIKYPFSKAEQNLLTAEFREQELLQDQQLERLAADIDNVKSVENIAAALAELRTMQAGDEDNRKISTLIARYSALYRSIIIVDQGSVLGMIKYSLRLGNNIIASASNPRITTNCAAVTNFSIGSHVNEISYNYDGCYPDEENFTEIKYTFEGRIIISHKFYIKIPNT